MQQSFTKLDNPLTATQMSVGGQDTSFVNHLPTELSLQFIETPPLTPRVPPIMHLQHLTLNNSFLLSQPAQTTSTQMNGIFSRKIDKAAIQEERSPLFKQKIQSLLSDPILNTQNKPPPDGILIASNNIYSSYVEPKQLLDEYLYMSKKNNSQLDSGTLLKTFQYSENNKFFSPVDAFASVSQSVKVPRMNQSPVGNFRQINAQTISTHRLQVTTGYQPSDRFQGAGKTQQTNVSLVLTVNDVCNNNSNNSQSLYKEIPPLLDENFLSTVISPATLEILKEQRTHLRKTTLLNEVCDSPSVKGGLLSNSQKQVSNHTTSPVQISFNNQLNLQPNLASFHRPLPTLPLDGYPTLTSVITSAYTTGNPTTSNYSDSTYYLPIIHPNGIDVAFSDRKPTFLENLPVTPTVASFQAKLLGSSPQPERQNLENPVQLKIYNTPVMSTRGIIIPSPQPSNPPHIASQRGSAFKSSEIWQNNTLAPSSTIEAQSNTVKFGRTDAQQLKTDSYPISVTTSQRQVEVGAAATAISPRAKDKWSERALEMLPDIDAQHTQSYTVLTPQSSEIIKLTQISEPNCTTMTLPVQQQNKCESHFQLEDSLMLTNFSEKKLDILPRSEEIKKTNFIHQEPTPNASVLVDLEQKILSNKLTVICQSIHLASNQLLTDLCKVGLEKERFKSLLLESYLGDFQRRVVNVRKDQLSQIGRYTQPIQSSSTGIEWNDKSTSPLKIPRSSVNINNPSPQIQLRDFTPNTRKQSKAFQNDKATVVTSFKKTEQAASPKSSSLQGDPVILNAVEGKSPLHTPSASCLQQKVPIRSIRSPERAISPHKQIPSADLAVACKKSVTAGTVANTLNIKRYSDVLHVKQRVQQINSHVITSPREVLVNPTSTFPLSVSNSQARFQALNSISNTVYGSSLFKPASQKQATIACLRQNSGEKIFTQTSPQPWRQANIYPFSNSKIVSPKFPLRNPSNELNPRSNTRNNQATKKSGEFISNRKEIVNQIHMDQRLLFDAQPITSPTVTNTMTSPCITDRSILANGEEDKPRTSVSAKKATPMKQVLRYKQESFFSTTSPWKQIITTPFKLHQH